MFLDVCPPDHVCTSAISMSPEQATWALVLFIVACCVLPFIGGGRRS